MQISQDGASFLRVHEGFVDHWYKDPVGIGTIGTGFTWASEGFRHWWGKNRPGQAFGPGAKMTRAEADDCLVMICGLEYGKAVNDYLKKAVPQHVFDGMVSPVYNCGAGTLKDGWAEFARAGDYKTAAVKLAVTRVTAKGKRLEGLVRRRREEGILIRDGVYVGVTKTRLVAEPDPLADGMLVRGERGAAVAALIRDLAVLGYYTGRQDDVFGYGTEAAVLKFQRDRGLKDDGFAGPKTLKEIARSIAMQQAPKQGKPLSFETETKIKAAVAAQAAPAPVKRAWWEVLVDALLRIATIRS